tara:strand:+ start:1047 stop:1589 length:543 start_codon:yes stop_codon:yes gene_type:complete
MFKLKLFGAFSLTSLLLGCASQESQMPIKNLMSTMEVRSLQTKEYQTSDHVLVYKGLINALLDRGFTLKSSDADSGVVIAHYISTQTNENEIIKKAFATYFSAGLAWVFGDNNFEDTLTVDISANVTELSGVSTVRINAVGKRMNSEGEIVETQMVTDKNYYNDIFQQIEKAIFIEENLN